MEKLLLEAKQEISKILNERSIVIEGVAVKFGLILDKMEIDGLTPEIIEELVEKKYTLEDYEVIITGVSVMFRKKLEE